MGIPIPQPNGQDPKSVNFMGIVTGDLWNEAIGPENINGLYELSLEAAGWWRGVKSVEGFEIVCSVRDINPGWKVTLNVLAFGIEAFSDTGEVGQETFYNENEYIRIYSSGTGSLALTPEPTEVAELMQLPYLQKTFYEPMPLAANPRSFRYACQGDGTRVYIRKE